MFLKWRELCLLLFQVNVVFLEIWEKDMTEEIFIEANQEGFEKVCWII